MFFRKAKRGGRGNPKKKKKMRLVLSSNYNCHVLGQPGARSPRSVARSAAASRSARVR